MYKALNCSVTEAKCYDVGKCIKSLCEHNFVLCLDSLYHILLHLYTCMLTNDCISIIEQMLWNQHMQWHDQPQEFAELPTSGLADNDPFIKCIVHDSEASKLFCSAQNLHIVHNLID